MTKLNYRDFKKNVMMVGTDPKGKGGIASVIKGYYRSGIIHRQKIDYYSSHCDGNRLKKIIFYLKCLLVITSKINNYKIIHVHMASHWSFRRLLIVLIIAKIFKKKKVIHIHGATFHYFYKKASNLEKLLIRFAFSDSERVIVLSVEWIKKIQSFCDKKKIIVIPNSVSLQSKKNYKTMLASEFPKIILFLGEIGGRKGVYDLIKALSLIKDQSNFKAFLCGTGQIKKANEKIKIFGLEGKVILTGWIYEKEKEQLLRDAYLYILPSYHEGLPMSILEAMAAGTPVISTPVGGIPQLLQNGMNGYIVPKKSPHHIAQRILELIEKPAIWEKLSKNAYNTIKSKFSLDQTEKKLNALYNSLN